MNRFKPMLIITYLTAYLTLIIACNSPSSDSPSPVSGGFTPVPTSTPSGTPPAGGALSTGIVAADQADILARSQALLATARTQLEHPVASRTGDPNLSHTPNGQALVQDPHNRDLQIISNPVQVSHILKRFQIAESGMQVVGAPQFRLHAITQEQPAGDLATTDHIDAILLEQGIQTLRTHPDTNIPLLISTDKPYRASLLCISVNASCVRIIPNALSDSQWQVDGREIQVIPHFMTDTITHALATPLNPGEQWMIRFVAVSNDTELHQYRATIQVSDLQQAMDHPTHPGNNPFLQQATAAAVAKYTQVSPRPQMLDFIRRFQLANCEMAALAADQILEERRHRQMGTPTQSALAAGYLSHDAYIDFNAENHAWNVLYHDNQLGTLANLDVTPTPSTHLSLAFNQDTLAWFNTQLAQMNSEANLKLGELIHSPTISRINRSIITGIHNSIFTPMTPENLAVIQEIRIANPEDRILNHILEQLLPTQLNPVTPTAARFERITTLTPELARIAGNLFTCGNAICYKQVGTGNYYRIYVENHTVNYGPVGAIPFYISSSAASVYDLSPFSENNTFSATQLDMRRSKLFHLASPALEIAAYPNIHSSVFHNPAHLQPSLFVDRFDPTTRNTDAWFSMNWNPTFTGRRLTTELAEVPQFKLIRSELIRNFENSAIIGAYLNAYLDAFPVTNREEVLELFQRGGDYNFRLDTSEETFGANSNTMNPNYLQIIASYMPGELYAEMGRQEAISLEAYQAASDRYSAACRDDLIHYIMAPTRAELEDFWRSHGLYNSFYEIKLNLFSFIPNAL